MCRYVVFHSDQFSHPYSAFALGILVVIVNCLCEVTNTFYALSRKDVADVISKFVAFKILIQVQDYYNRQRANFSIRKEVAASPLIIIEDPSKIFGKKKKSKASSASSTSASANQRNGGNTSTDEKLEPLRESEIQNKVGSEGKSSDTKETTDSDSKGKGLFMRMLYYF